MSGKPAYPHAVVQVLWKENPREAPYRDKNGILIVETNELCNFFEEYAQVRNVERAREEEGKRALEELARDMQDPAQEVVRRFIDQLAFRRFTLRVLSHSPIHLISGFISLLDKCVDEPWRRSAPYGHFQGYAQNLDIILDILTAFEAQNIPPALFQTAAYALHRVAGFVGRAPGESWDAARIWEGRKGELSAEVVAELRSVAANDGYSGIQRLLGGM